jgi:transcriptional regulator with XRE-family HTH domain
METSGQRIRAFRLSHSPRLSVEDLGNQVGRSKATISKIENGLQLPSPKVAKALSEITGIPAKELRPDLAEIMEINAEAAE